MNLSRTGLIAISLLSAVVQGHAYNTNHAWVGPNVPYYINTSNTQGIPAAEMIADLRLAAATWSTQANVNVQFTYAGTGNGNTLVNDGRNNVFFRNDANGSLAECYRWWNGINLIDMDIVFHEQYVWFTGNTGCNGGVYIFQVGAHEFGHGLGMDHSFSGTTMQDATNYCDRSPETLEPDDIAGIQSLYPRNNPDNIGPAVWLDQPAKGSTVSGPVNLVPLAFDNTGVARVEYFLDGSATRFANVTSAPFTFSWNTATVSNGSHTLTAKAYDAGGRSWTTLHSLSVTVSNAAASPDVTISKSASPASMSSGGTTTFTITYQNASSVTAENVIITDDIPAGSTLVAGSITSPSGVTSSVSGNTITWTVGNVAVGAAAKSVSFQVRAN